MIEITLRECRFCGSKNALIITRTLYIVISLGLRGNYAMRVSVKLIMHSLVITFTDHNITKWRKEVCISTVCVHVQSDTCVLFYQCIRVRRDEHTE